MPQIYDALIIGGGAAGMCAAISLKQKNINISVAIIEQLPRVGKKLITTGNGRCNITNRNIDISRYHGFDVDFAEYALDNYGNSAAEEFFRSIGVIFCFDEVGRAYPYSLQASSVVDALRFACDDMGIKTFTETIVSDYEKTKSGYCLNTNKGSFCGKTVIAATGLCSGGKSLGSTGGMFSVFKNHGYNTHTLTPAIVQIKTETDIVRSLKGIKVNATASLYCGKNLIRREFGEVLFCDYGLSGPPILQISRAVERDSGEKKVVLDLMPEYSFADVFNILCDRAKVLYGRKLDEFFTGMLNKRVGQAVIKACGLKLNDGVDILNKSNIKALADKLKAFGFKAVGTMGFENSQVTAGGLDTSDFSSDSMMSKREKGMFAIGEILDIDGDCGGFNLQWAWSSAMCAADAIIKYLE